MKEKLTQKVSAKKTIQKLNGMADVLAGMKKKTNSKKEPDFKSGSFSILLSPNII
jgi:hypothetical protein